jgi:2-polyprenyl-3-methyl-5-hydroxy-6-metoxy-1,4-benzoquinol methylase
MAGDREGKPDVDALVAELRARVQERQRSGMYPPGLEEELAGHARGLLRHRREPPEVDLRQVLGEVQEALPLEPARIPVDSRVPGGKALHRVVARLVGRQTQGTLEQVQSFAQPVREALEAVVAVLEDLTHEVRVEMVQHLDAIYERQAAQERAAVQSAALERLPHRAEHAGRRAPFQPWYSSSRFEDEFRGTREEMLERYRDLAERLAGSGPVLDLGCGRGDFLELLTGLGTECSGVDLDHELVKVAADRGLPVEQGDGLRWLERREDASLGAVVGIQVVEHLSAQEVVDLVALAADKVRPGGRVFLETVNPQSLYVFAHAFYLDPTHLRPVHPAYLAFLFREAGFAAADIEWRSPPPAGDVLEEVLSGHALPGAINANVRRLNQLLFAPQDYLLAATR